MADLAAIILSSSSEDENFEEFNVLFDNDHRCNLRKIPRVPNHIETVIHRYNNEEFRQTFRLRRTISLYLLNLLAPDLQNNEEFGHAIIHPEKQLYICLYMSGTPDSYRSVCTKFDVGAATAWRAVFRVVKLLYRYRNYFIHWPTQNGAENCSTYVERKSRIPGVIGAVDGTHIHVSPPARDRESYINRDKYPSVQLQVVCNEKLEFIHCFAGFPGCVHDMRVFKHSGLQDLCNGESLYNNSHILGDSAYTLQQHVIVPFINNGFLTDEHLHFNTVHAKVRSMVERSIALFKGRWRWTLDRLPIKRMDLIPYYIFACCILHNICLKPFDHALLFPVIPPEEQIQNRGALAPNQYQQQQGVIKRDAIMDVLY